MHLMLRLFPILLSLSSCFTFFSFSFFSIQYNIFRFSPLLLLYVKETWIVRKYICMSRASEYLPPHTQKERLLLVFRQLIPSYIFNLKCLPSFQPQFHLSILCERFWWPLCPVADPLQLAACPPSYQTRAHRGRPDQKPA